MRTFLIGLPIILGGCWGTSTQFIAPAVPQELREPCYAPKRERGSLRDVALILTDHVEALDCANGRIIAIDEVLTEWEGSTDQPPNL